MKLSDDMRHALLELVYLLDRSTRMPRTAAPEQTDATDASALDEVTFRALRHARAMLDTDSREGVAGTLSKPPRMLPPVTLGHLIHARNMARLAGPLAPLSRKFQP